MTTFTMQDLNQINDLPNTPEEDEAMEALAKLGGGISFHDLKVVGAITPTQHAPTPQPSGEIPHNPSLTDIINNICTQLQLLSSVISQAKAQPVEDNVSSSAPLQETVALVLQQAEWFKETVEEKVETLVDDMDHTYEIESAVETYFSNSFSLDDHVDITAEVESKVEEIAEDLLKDIVQEQLEEVVAEKLKNLRITFD